MRPAQRYASFVVRLWYADNLEPATTSFEPLRGQIIHVQSDRSGGVQNLEEIMGFIEAHLFDSPSPPTINEDAIAVTDDQETLSVENSTENLK